MLSLLTSGGSSLIVYIVVAFVLVAGSFAEGYHVASDHAAAQQLEAQKQVQAQIAAEAAKYDAAASQLEQQKAQQHAVVQTITKTVDRLVSRPVYLNVCLDDDGVHAVNDAIAGASTAASGPNEPLPAPGPAR